MWAFKRLWDKGLVYEGFRVLPYCWRCETPLSNPETRMDDDSTGREDPALTVGFQLDSGERLLAVDDHAVDAAVQPRARRRPGRRLRGPGARRRALRPRRGPAGGVRPRARRGDRRAAGRHPERQRAGRPHLRAAVPLLRRHRQRLPGPRRRLRHDRGRHRRRPHGARPSARTTRTLCAADGIPVVLPVDDRAHFTDVVRATPGMHVFDANTHIIRDLKARGLVVRHETYDHSYPHCWRCDTPLIYKAMSSWYVRGHQVPRPHGRAQQGDQLGARARPRRHLRQMAGERPRLVDQPQPLLGRADPGVEAATTRRTRASTSTARSTSWSATSACGRPTCTGPRSTS